MNKLIGWMSTILCVTCCYFVMQGVVGLGLDRWIELTVSLVLVGWVGFSGCYFIYKVDL